MQRVDWGPDLQLCRVDWGPDGSRDSGWDAGILCRGEMTVFALGGGRNCNCFVWLSAQGAGLS